MILKSMCLETISLVASFYEVEWEQDWFQPAQFHHRPSEPGGHDAVGYWVLRTRGMCFSMEIYPGLVPQVDKRCTRGLPPHSPPHPILLSYKAYCYTMPTIHTATDLTVHG